MVRSTQVRWRRAGGDRAWSERSASSSLLRQTPTPGPCYWFSWRGDEDADIRASSESGVEQDLRVPHSGDAGRPVSGPFGLGPQARRVQRILGGSDGATWKDTTQGRPGMVVIGKPEDSIGGPTIPSRRQRPRQEFFHGLHAFVF